MTAVGWTTAGVLVLVAVAAALAATRLPALEPLVRRAILALEGWLVVLAVADVGLVLRASEEDRPGSLITHVGYALVVAGLVPLVANRPSLEPGGDTDNDTEAHHQPASLWVLVVALLAVAVCVVRLVQTR